MYYRVPGIWPNHSDRYRFADQCANGTLLSLASEILTFAISLLFNVSFFVCLVRAPLYLFWISVGWYGAFVVILRQALKITLSSSCRLSLFCVAVVHRVSPAVVQLWTNRFGVRFETRDLILIGLRWFQSDISIKGRYADPGGNNVVIERQAGHMGALISSISKRFTFCVFNGNVWMLK